MISLISFFYWLTAALPSSAFFRLRIHKLLTPVNVLIHTLHIYYTLCTPHKHTPGSICLFFLVTRCLSHVTLLLFPALPPLIPSTSTPSPHLFSQNGNLDAEELVYSHYVICNDTHETLRFGQVDTDENVLLASLHSHQYSWRSHKSPQVAHSHTHCVAQGLGNIYMEHIHIHRHAHTSTLHAQDSVFRY